MKSIQNPPAAPHAGKSLAQPPAAPGPAWPEPQTGGRYVRDPVTGALQPQPAAPAPKPASTDTPEE